MVQKYHHNALSLSPYPCLSLPVSLPLILSQHPSNRDKDNTVSSQSVSIRWYCQSLHCVNHTARASSLSKDFYDLFSGFMLYCIWAGLTTLKMSLEFCYDQKLVLICKKSLLCYLDGGYKRKTCRSVSIKTNLALFSRQLEVQYS